MQCRHEVQHTRLVLSMFLTTDCVEQGGSPPDMTQLFSEDRKAENLTGYPAL